jgi:6-phosphogluconolactonase/glucosamine-6-phosphate isomerase/deaminase
VPFRELVVVDDAGAEAGRRLGAAIGDAVAERGAATIALSGGSAPGRMLPSVGGDVDWAAVDIVQVDERIAPDGDEDRNLGPILGHLPAAARPRVRPMPVTAQDLEAAADAYAVDLPSRFDVIHLGIGADGHTASLVPGDPVLDVLDRDVALTSEAYQGRRRMTLTFPALARAGLVLWLVTGRDKAVALRKLLADDERIPASRVAAPRQVVVADPAATMFGSGA